MITRRSRVSDAGGILMRQRPGASALLSTALVLGTAGSTAAAPAIAQPAPRAAIAAPSRPTPSAGARVPVLRWRSCGGGFQCTRARVPLDYGAPGGTTISLALIRLPATDRQHRIGSLFVNPGGPGLSGVQLVRQEGRFLVTAPVRARFDIVGFDPRGVGSSTPVHCYPNAAAEARGVGSLPAFPTRTGVAAYFRAFDRFDARCRQRAATLLSHVSTADVARDLDLLRRAVGDRKLTYDGVSYGTFLGEVYANLFPQNVRALVLDGVLNPVAWSTGRPASRSLPFSFRIGSAQGAEATLHQFFRTCAAATSACAFSRGGPARKFAVLVGKAKAGRLMAGGQQLSWPYLDEVTLSSLYSPLAWPQLAAGLQQLWAGLPSAPSALGQLRAQVAPLGNYPNGTDAYAAVSCADTTNPRTDAAWRRAAAAGDRTAPYFGDIWTYSSAACAAWRGPAADRYTGPWNARTASPVLVIGNRFDPATPYAGARFVAGLLPRARLLTLNGYGHTAVGKSACIDRARDTYLVTLRLPARGKVCQPDLAPFQNSPAGASRVSAARAATLAALPPTLRPSYAG